MAEDNFIPVRVVASDAAGNEEFVGDFPAGIVLTNTVIQDPQTSQIIANLVAVTNIQRTTVPEFMWDVPRMKKRFKYIFCQVMPQDAPVTVTIDGKRKRVY